MLRGWPSRMGGISMCALGGGAPGCPLSLLEGTTAFHVPVNVEFERLRVGISGGLMCFIRRSLTGWSFLLASSRLVTRS